jgi:hypothetical protein
VSLFEGQVLFVESTSWSFALFSRKICRGIFILGCPEHTSDLGFRQISDFCVNRLCKNVQLFIGIDCSGAAHRPTFHPRNNALHYFVSTGKRRKKSQTIQWSVSRLVTFSNYVIQRETGENRHFDFVHRDAAPRRPDVHLMEPPHWISEIDINYRRSGENKKTLTVGRNGELKGSAPPPQGLVISPSLYTCLVHFWGFAVLFLLTISGSTALGSEELG